MKIIGEKINGTRKRVAAAIADRDDAHIGALAVAQTDAGAAWLDVNAGTHPAREPDDLVWLIETIQSIVDTPLVIDSANPAAIERGLEVAARTPMINSISGEPIRLSGILPLVAESGAQVVALAMDDNGIPSNAPARMEIVRKLITATRDAGVPDDDVYVDPLVMTVATDTDSALVSLDTMRLIRDEYPAVHMTVGLSNVSFGLPARALVNRGFLTLAMAAGLDTAIADPTDRELRAQTLATDLLLGRDRHCLGFVRASRTGLFDPIGEPQTLDSGGRP